MLRSGGNQLAETRLTRNDIQPRFEPAFLHTRLSLALMTLASFLSALLLSNPVWSRKSLTRALDCRSSNFNVSSIGHGSTSHTL
ncbi:hypothetical protein BCR37DRAFT_377580 [Protomyces lactucae-debilis]|uniref:Uncharacterized protein n=1 Tax=Protomyces lactucae-debilis TaxID=2754530 RepID=A0A1Y2FLG2_PROLT|nr:uncharacterized protein BCR37DRAFT_377580 [Protomyces lactucae-debilis]ORY84803.1 hypothetical protein BCR37DRAFT_377580 [Protomyces lactucae-debilis]